MNRIELSRALIFLYAFTIGMQMVPPIKWIYVIFVWVDRCTVKSDMYLLFVGRASLYDFFQSIVNLVIYTPHRIKVRNANKRKRLKRGERSLLCTIKRQSKIMFATCKSARRFACMHRSQKDNSIHWHARTGGIMLKTQTRTRVT